MRCCQIQHHFKCIKDLCKLGKEYLTSADIEVLYFFLDKISNFQIIRPSYFHATFEIFF